MQGAAEQGTLFCLIPDEHTQYCPESTIPAIQLVHAPISTHNYFRSCSSGSSNRTPLSSD